MKPALHGGDRAGWFRVFLAGWSVALVLLLGWLATHRSSEPDILGRYSPGYAALLGAVASLASATLMLQAPFLYPRVQGARRTVVLAAASLLISLATAEVALREWDPLGLSHFREGTRYTLDKVADPILVYKHASRLAALAGMATFLPRAGHRVRDVLLPSARRIESTLRAQLLDEIRMVGGKQGFRVSDTGEWWGDLDRRSVQNSIVDPHPNARGHQILAAGMAGVLLAHGLVGPRDRESR